MSTFFWNKLPNKNFFGRLETKIENNNQVFQIQENLVKWILWKTKQTTGSTIM